MNEKSAEKTSKFLSYVLRHQPGAIEIELDEAGWIDVEHLLAALRKHGKPLSRRKLEQVVTENDKQRFAFNEDRSRIRANQGHSVQVELGYQPAEPPEVLYHGTTRRFLASITAAGLHKGSRHHVHLSSTRSTASAVGGRRGAPVILTVRTGDMHRAGISFFVTPNQVWLTDEVPPEYIELPGS